VGRLGSGLSLPALQPCEAAAKLRTSLALQDTPVASGSVHSPWKQQVGARLARGALSVAYGMPEVAKVNPTATSAKLSGTAITVELTGLGANGVMLHSGNKLGFEALGKDGSWHSTPITSTAASSVTVGPAPAGARAVRYLWYPSPCSPYPGQPRELMPPQPGFVCIAAAPLAWFPSMRRRAILLRLISLELLVSRRVVFRGAVSLPRLHRR
jgi:hypothetical protein